MKPGTVIYSELNLQHTVDHLVSHMLTKKHSMTLKGGQVDFTQDHCDRYRDNCNGVL